MLEQIARLIEPDAWKATGRDASTFQPLREESLAKARDIFSTLMHPNDAIVAKVNAENEPWDGYNTKLRYQAVLRAMLEDRASVSAR